MASALTYSDWDLEMVPTAHLIAQNLTIAKGRGHKHLPTTAELVHAIASIQVNGTMKGVSNIVVTLNDPSWALLDSGFFDTDEDSKIDAIDINFPPNSRYWWRLTQVSPAGADKQLAMTFLVREALYLMAIHKFKKANRARMSRAEFLASCVADVTEGSIEFFCQHMGPATSKAGGDLPGIVRMYDATGGTLASIPKNAGAVASYVDNYGGYSAAVTMFKNIPVVSISVTPGNNVAAYIYDCEPGGKSRAETIAAIKAGRAQGAYGGADDLKAISDGLAAQGVKRSSYKLWLAAWPGTGANVTAGYDAHQYASGSDYDRSMALGSFFDQLTTPSGLIMASAPGASVPEPSIYIPYDPTPVASSQNSKNGAKSGGLGNNLKGLTSQGAPLTKAQAEICNTLLSVCDNMNAPTVVRVAMIYAGIWESNLNPAAHNDLGYGGVLSSNYMNVPWSHTQDQARDFLTGKSGSGYASALGLAKGGITNPTEIAIKTENPSIWPANAYQSNPSYPGDTAAIAEAGRIVKAGGGGTISTSGSGSVQSTTTTTQVEAYYFKIGRAEGYWNGMTRLAQEVNWELFFDGNRLYYDSEQTLITQKPIARIDRDDAVVADWSYDWDARQICTQMTLVLFDRPFEFPPGEVIELTGFGPASTGSSAKPPQPGRWLIQDSQRSSGDVTTSYTLVQPDLPKMEPAPQTKQVTHTTTANATGYSGKLQSPFTKKYGPLTLLNTDMGVDIGTQHGMRVGDPIMAPADCYCRGDQEFYVGSINPQALWFEWADNGTYKWWGWYISEQIDKKLGPSSKLIKKGTVVATFAAVGTAIEIGWAAGPGSTVCAALYPGEVATRHDGNGTTPGRDFRDWLINAGGAYA